MKGEREKNTGPSSLSIQMNHHYITMTTQGICMVLVLSAILFLSSKYYVSIGLDLNRGAISTIWFCSLG